MLLVHIITDIILDVTDAIMHQLPNESAKRLNILFKNLWVISYAQQQ